MKSIKIGYNSKEVEVSYQAPIITMGFQTKLDNSPTYHTFQIILTITGKGSEPQDALGTTRFANFILETFHTTRLVDGESDLADKTGIETFVTTSDQVNFNYLGQMIMRIIRTWILENDYPTVSVKSIEFAIKK